MIVVASSFKDLKPGDKTTIYLLTNKGGKYPGIIVRGGLTLEDWIISQKEMGFNVQQSAIDFAKSLGNFYEVITD